MPPWAEDSSFHLRRRLLSQLLARDRGPDGSERSDPADRGGLRLDAPKRAAEPLILVFGLESIKNTAAHTEPPTVRSTRRGCTRPKAVSIGLCVLKYCENTISPRLIVGGGHRVRPGRRRKSLIRRRASRGSCCTHRASCQSPTRPASGSLDRGRDPASLKDHAAPLEGTPFEPSKLQIS
ncbi:hypothetical protein N658DRAFT_223808 [Parathielavia hyrcaniae]|uniref:Uncharacterized protein n=1 Tax=Parathielavia hyrcaniae TaxID=113614 RepID=A0AAN6PYA4_9PEZI|nr:hypothetical protein N658DRAFT_223808 [Parathielavia hyrcaniae]